MLGPTRDCERTGSMAAGCLCETHTKLLAPPGRYPVREAHHHLWLRTVPADCQRDAMHGALLQHCRASTHFLTPRRLCGQQLQTPFECVGAPMDYADLGCGLAAGRTLESQQTAAMVQC